MRETDTDNDGVVSFAELVTLMHKLKKDPNSSNLFVRKIHKAPAQVRNDCNRSEFGRVISRRCYLR